MRERRDAAFGRRVAFRLRLAHPVPRGRDVDDGSAFAKVALEQLGKVEHHVGNVHRVADASGKMLGGVGAIVSLARRVNPSWRDRVDADASGEAGGERVRERGDSALGGGVALTLRWLILSREEEILTMDAPSAK